MPRRLPTAELETLGLSTEEAGRRLAEVGANEIQRAQRTSRWKLLARQLASPLIWLLLAAAGFYQALHLTSVAMRHRERSS